MIEARHAPSRSEALACLALGALAGAAVMVSYPVPVALLTGILVAGVALVTLIDLRHMIIPDVLSLPLIPLGLLANALAFGEMDWQEPLLDGALAAAVAGAVLYGLRLAYFHFRGIEGLGLGDVKLAAAAGAWVGLALLPATCLAASLSALAAVGLSRKRASAQTAIPFGSFIAPSIAAVWLWRLFGGG